MDTSGIEEHFSVVALVFLHAEENLPSNAGNEGQPNVLRSFSNACN